MWQKDAKLNLPREYPHINVVFTLFQTPGVALNSSDAGGDDQRSSDVMWQKMRSLICRANIQT